MRPRADRAWTGPVPPPQLHPGRAMPLRDGDRLRLRQRRLPPRSTDRCRHGRLGRLRGRRAASETAGRRRGRGIAFFIEQGGVFNDRMELRFDPAGTVTIVAGTFSHGQGHETTYAQMVVRLARRPFPDIRFVQGDTDKVPFGRGTYAARSSMVGGSALRLAAETGHRPLPSNGRRSPRGARSRTWSSPTAASPSSGRRLRSRSPTSPRRSSIRAASPTGTGSDLTPAAPGRPRRRTSRTAATSARSRSTRNRPGQHRQVRDRRRHRHRHQPADR